MSDVLNIVVPGQPVPKARPLFNAKTKVAYTPFKSRAYERRVFWYAKQAGKRFSGDVVVEMVFFRKNGVSCDLDNLAKAVLDGLTGAVFANDSQVVGLHAWKDEDGENPRVEVQIYEKDVFEQQERESINEMMSRRG